MLRSIVLLNIDAFAIPLLHPLANVDCCDLAPDLVSSLLEYVVYSMSFVLAFVYILHVRVHVFHEKAHHFWLPTKEIKPLPQAWKSTLHLGTTPQDHNNGRS